MVIALLPQNVYTGPNGRETEVLQMQHSHIQSHPIARRNRAAFGASTICVVVRGILLVVCDRVVIYLTEVNPTGDFRDIMHYQ